MIFINDFYNFPLNKHQRIIDQIFMNAWQFIDRQTYNSGGSLPKLEILSASLSIMGYT